MTVRNTSRHRTLKTLETSLGISEFVRKFLCAEGNKGFFFFMFLQWVVFPITSSRCCTQTDCCCTISPWWSVGWERKEEERSWCVSSENTLFDGGGGGGDLSCMCAPLRAHTQTHTLKLTHTQTLLNAGTDGNLICNMPLVWATVTQ